MFPYKGLYDSQYYFLHSCSNSNGYFVSEKNLNAVLQDFNIKISIRILLAKSQIYIFDSNWYGE